MNRLPMFSKQLVLNLQIQFLLLFLCSIRQMHYDRISEKLRQFFQTLAFGFGVEHDYDDNAHDGEADED